MGTSTFSADFRCDAVAHITGRGYPVSGVWERIALRHNTRPEKRLASRPRLTGSTGPLR